MLENSVYRTITDVQYMFFSHSFPHLSRSPRDFSATIIEIKSGFTTEYWSHYTNYTATEGKMVSPHRMAS